MPMARRETIIYLDGTQKKQTPDGRVRSSRKVLRGRAPHAAEVDHLQAVRPVLPHPQPTHALYNPLQPLPPLAVVVDDTLVYTLGARRAGVPTRCPAQARPPCTPNLT